MLVAFAVVALVVVFVIAAVVIGRESVRLSVEVPRPVFDLDEAVASVADRIPFEISAVLSHDDVRRMLRWNLADLQSAAVVALDAAGTAGREAGGGDGGDGDVGRLPPSPLTVMGEEEAVVAVRTRAEAEGLEYTDDQIRAVLDAHLAYLELIGAVGPADLDREVPVGGGRNGATDDSVVEEKGAGDPAEGGDIMSAPEKGGGPAEQTL